MPLGETATAPSGSVGVMASAWLEEEIDETREAPCGERSWLSTRLREEQARPFGVADRPVVCAGQRPDQEG